MSNLVFEPLPAKLSTSLGPRGHGRGPSQRPPVLPWMSIQCLEPQAARAHGQRIVGRVYAQRLPLADGEARTTAGDKRTQVSGQRRAGKNVGVGGSVLQMGVRVQSSTRTISRIAVPPHGDPTLMGGLEVSQTCNVWTRSK